MWRTEEEHQLQILRFTGFFHLGEYWHSISPQLWDDHRLHYAQYWDDHHDDGILTREHVGLFDENDEVKIKAPFVFFGVPFIALKFGNFKRRTFVFAGAEYRADVPL